jgi:hypothetical protein
MVYSEYCRDKLARSKIEGQSKPFVDGNLQFHFPEFDSEHPQHSTAMHHPIYAHFTNHLMLEKSNIDQINEKEIYRAMAQAEQSYQAWKKLQNLITEFARSLLMLGITMLSLLFLN